MSQQNRATLSLDITSNVYTNSARLIKGNTVKQRLLNLNDSCLNITTDLNVVNGYLGIDVNGRVNISFINAATQTGKYLRDDGTWSAVLVLNQTLTGFTSGAGTVAASDTILQAIQKIDGNTNNFQEAFELSLQASYLYLTNR